MFWKWTKRLLLGAFSVIIFCLISGMLYQSIATKMDEKKYPPLGQMIDVGGFRLHLYTTGKEGPTVVLESGLGSHSLDWAVVQSSVSQFAKVCSYDRAGYGWSEESPRERTSMNMVEELHTLLTKSGLPGPYILVGHSLGGVQARLFASRYPSEIAGVVLVDSAHEDQFDKMPKAMLPNEPLMLWMSRLGIIRLMSHTSQYQTAQQQMFGKLPLHIQQMRNAHTLTTKNMNAALSELSNLQKSLSQLKQDGGQLGDKPLIVITATQTMPVEGTGLTQEEVNNFLQSWTAFQKDLLKNSTRSFQIFADQSDHEVPLRQPDVIVEAIQTIMEQTHER
jgi:pimeloyl-ACP methyl ester carboxylesterase